MQGIHELRVLGFFRFRVCGFRVWGLGFRVLGHLGHGIFRVRGLAVWALGMWGALRLCREPLKSGPGGAGRYFRLDAHTSSSALAPHPEQETPSGFKEHLTEKVEH